MTSVEVFEYYSDYYAYAADMHRKIYTSFDGLGNQILQLNNYLTKNDLQGQDFAKNLVNNLQSLQISLITNFSQIHYLEDSFVALSKYVRNKFGTTVDTMLTNENIKVFNSYAKVSDSLAEPISASNIKPD